MGRDRLRRGYSLEVIFEEDSDFCSHIDSLDAVPLGYPTDANNNTPPHQHLQKEFSLIELFGLRTSNTPHNSENLRSDIPERTPPTKSWDELLDTKDMATCYLECDVFSSDSRDKSNFGDCHSQAGFRDLRELSPSSESQRSSSGRRSRVSRRQIVEATWMVEEEDDLRQTWDMDRHFPEIEFTNTFKLDGKMVSFLSRGEDYDSENPPTLVIDAQTNISCDSIQLTRSSETNFKADDDMGSPLTPNYSSPLSSSGIEDIDQNMSSESRSTSASSSSTEVKRIREIFESGRPPLAPSVSSEDEITNTLLVPAHRFQKRQNQISTSRSNSKLVKKFSTASNGSLNSIGIGGNLMRPALSQMSLNQIERYDYVDLLVNDNIIIEDSPDLFQTLRNSRNRSESREWGSKNNLFFKCDTPSPKFTLRRSKSVGTGIHNLESEMSQSETCQDDLRKSRPSVLAEELPARNTVRNVRSVFEQILQNKGHPITSPDETSSTGGNSNGTKGSVEDKNNVKDKALTFIKSNPTSKIFRRAESGRDETDGGKGQYGHRVLLKSQSVQETTISKPKFQNGPRNPNFASQGFRNQSLDDDSVLATSNRTEDHEEPKLISPEVLNKIRSVGTTTTYFGGEIVSKTVKNQRCAISKRNLSPDEGWFDEIDRGHFPPPPQQFQVNSDDLFFAVKPKGSSKSPDRRPHHLPLESFYKGKEDTTPRIISVLPKSPSNSPTKSNSPVGSFIEGRNSPEGCESNPDHQANSEGWINTDNSKTVSNDFPTVQSKKFSDAAEGVWF